MIWVQFSIWKVFDLRRIGGSERLIKEESYALPRATPSYHRVARRVKWSQNRQIPQKQIPIVGEFMGGSDYAGSILRKIWHISCMVLDF